MQIVTMTFQFYPELFDCSCYCSLSMSLQLLLLVKASKSLSTYEFIIVIMPINILINMPYIRSFFRLFHSEFHSLYVC